MSSNLTFYTSSNFKFSNGTHYQGRVLVDYDKLVKIFGPPLKGDEYKTDAEWIVVFSDSTVATIYNWKNGKNYLGDEGLDVENIDDWHVGGKTPEALARIVEILKRNR